MSHKNLDFTPEFLNGEKDFIDFSDDNGLSLNNIYLPQEVLLHLLSFIEPKKLLQYCRVCRTWNKLIKSYSLWSIIYKRKYNNKPKKLPWYVYYCFFTSNYFHKNLLQNCNGEHRFTNWQMTSNGGGGFIIEAVPMGSDPLPTDVPEFNGKSSCFATSYGRCSKNQRIHLDQNKLLKFILENYKPHIYISEWVAGRFDCGCIYSMNCIFKDKDDKDIGNAVCGYIVQQWEGSKWTKLEMIVTEYPDNVHSIVFEHSGQDTQFWAGHYGSKFTGAVVKILFDTVDPLCVDEKGNPIPKTYNELKFATNGVRQEDMPIPIGNMHMYDEEIDYLYDEILDID